MDLPGTLYQVHDRKQPPTPHLLDSACHSGCLHTCSGPWCMQGMPTDADERNGHVFWKAKKWALHIAARMFTRYATPDAVGDERSDRAFAQLWAQHCSCPFLDVALELLSRFAQVRNEPCFAGVLAQSTQDWTSPGAGAPCTWH